MDIAGILTVVTSPAWPASSLDGQVTWKTKLLGYCGETKLATPIRRQQALSSVAQSRMSGFQRLSGRIIVMPIVVGDGLPHLDQRHREQIDRCGQADPARRFDGTRQIACQLLELFSP
ncbi:hypothetical protein [Bradyrhizobium sp. DOA1]|uniref:hypothetical protein n=1 Tax=Bradyrhizobium sp. DOA1 TaxID=1126616 RepID=UPI0018D401AA|nr:hypothetical protein [Bradyrhizobium sp. DOA1]